MQDLLSDWKKWSRGERVLALVMTGSLLALPLGLLLTANAGL